MYAPALTATISAAIFGVGIVLPFAVSKFGTRRAKLAPPGPLPAAPSLGVIIPAYLESGEIAGTIAALRSQLKNWPGESTITVVASDDATAAAAYMADVVHTVGRSGKPRACNVGVAASTADVVVLMDANCRISPMDWPKRLSVHLVDWSLVSANKSEQDGKESSFWRLESAIKKTSAGSVGSLAVVGEFIAFRRADYRELPAGIVLDDLWLAFDFHRSGLPVTVASDITTSELAASPRDQWERRVRINSGLLTEAVPNIPWLMKSSVGRVYIAHKLYRVTVGVAAFWLCVASFAFLLPPITFPVTIALVSTAIGMTSGRIKISLPFSQVFVLVGLQAVPVAGAVRAIQRRTRAAKGRLNDGWKKVAR